jgi:hypothetical protein
MLTVVSAASLPGSDQVPNEDWFRTGPGWMVVLDGVTPVPGNGCVHPIPWFVEQLGEAIEDGLSGENHSLRAILAGAIAATVAAHEGTCDLTSPQSPAAQVAILRAVDDRVEWLVLGDCTIVIKRQDEAPVAYCDDRADRLPDPPEPVLVNGIRRYPLEYVAAVRNRPGGFWVASTLPEAADEALHGWCPAGSLQSAALLSDGLTRLVERYGWTWPTLLDEGERQGAKALIRSVHDADRAAEPTGARGKTSDDATGVFIQRG